MVWVVKVTVTMSSGVLVVPPSLCGMELHGERCGIDDDAQIAVVGAIVAFQRQRAVDGEGRAVGAAHGFERRMASAAGDDDRESRGRSRYGCSAGSCARGRRRRRAARRPRRCRRCRYRPASRGCRRGSTARERRMMHGDDDRSGELVAFDALESSGQEAIWR